MKGRRRHVLPGEHRVDSRNGERLVFADGRDARVGVRRADDLEVKHPLHRDVHRVTGVAGDDRLGQGVGEAGAAGVAGPVRLDGSDAADRVLDRVVAGAATEVPLEVEGEVLLRLLGEARRGHDHARGAKAALERLGVEKRLLHRMELAVVASPWSVVTSRPSARKAGTRQLWTGLPSSQTVQAPQSPASHPFFTPNQPRSRRKCASTGRGGVRPRKDLPLIR